MKLPRDEIASGGQGLRILISAGPYIREDAFTNGDWSFYDLLVYPFVLELEVQDVEVKAAIGGPYHRHALDEGMGELMTVSLDNSVDRSSGKGFDEHGDLISGQASAVLDGGLIPHAKFIARVTVISDVPKKNHCICSSISQTLAAFNDNGGIGEKLIGKGAIIECGSGRWSLYC
jgi:hypothetical protein